MKWIEFAVYTSDSGIEAVCGALASVGIEQVSIEESAPRVEEHLRTLEKYWDFADAAALAAQNGPCVKAYLADLEENRAQLLLARAAVENLGALSAEFSFDPPRIEETRIDEEDWANTWKRYYKPILVGERLLICPLWEEASREDLAGRELVKMDPGMAFGTGGHDTTRLCMELMEREITPDSSVLDIGCGSGILSIAALKLGAKNAVCVDIDPVATRVVFENAAHNGIANERLRVHCGNILNDTALQNKVAGQYDCVAANIVADVILALSEFVPGLVKSGGCFVCSGIVLERADEVERALVRAGFVDIARRVSEETADAGALSTKWVAFCAKK